MKKADEAEGVAYGGSRTVLEGLISNITSKTSIFHPRYCLSRSFPPYAGSPRPITFMKEKGGQKTPEFANVIKPLSNALRVALGDCGHLGGKLCLKGIPGVEGWNRTHTGVSLTGF